MAGCVSVCARCVCCVVLVCAVLCVRSANAQSSTTNFSPTTVSTAATTTTLTIAGQGLSTNNHLIVILEASTCTGSTSNAPGVTVGTLSTSGSTQLFAPLTVTVVGSYRLCLQSNGSGPYLVVAGGQLLTVAEYTTSSFTPTSIVADVTVTITITGSGFNGGDQFFVNVAAQSSCTNSNAAGISVGPTVAVSSSQVQFTLSSLFQGDYILCALPGGSNSLLTVNGGTLGVTGGITTTTSSFSPTQVTAGRTTTVSILGSSLTMSDKVSAVSSTSSCSLTSVSGAVIANSFVPSDGSRLEVQVTISFASAVKLCIQFGGVGNVFPVNGGSLQSIEGSSGISDGVIAAIVVSVICGVGILVLLFVLWRMGKFKCCRPGPGTATVKGAAVSPTTKGKNSMMTMGSFRSTSRANRSPSVFGNGFTPKDVDNLDSFDSAESTASLMTDDDEESFSDPVSAKIATMRTQQLSAMGTSPQSFGSVSPRNHGGVTSAPRRRSFLDSNQSPAPPSPAFHSVNPTSPSGLVAPPEPPPHSPGPQLVRKVSNLSRVSINSGHSRLSGGSREEVALVRDPSTTPRAGGGSGGGGSSGSVSFTPQGLLERSNTLSGKQLSLTPAPSPWTFGEADKVKEALRGTREWTVSPLLRQGSKSSLSNNTTNSH